MTDKPAHPRQATGVSHPSRSERDLRERLKELTCLYAVSRDMQEQLLVDELCARVVEHLIPATQFPEITVPVIELRDRRFTSGPRRKKLSYGLHAPINVAGEAQGQLSVYYTEDRPFMLPDEQNLVNAVAEALGAWLERTQAQQDLKESEEKYRLITDNTSDLVAVTTFDSNPTFKYVSPSHRRLLGYEPAELLGQPALEVVHPTDKERLLSVLRRYLQAMGTELPADPGSEVSETIEFRARDKSGEYHWLETSADLVQDRLLLISRDVTARKQAEAALRQSEEAYRRLVENANDIIYSHDMEGNFTALNPAGLRTYGYSAEEVRHLNIADIIDPAYLSLAQRKISENLRGSARTEPYQLLTRSKRGHPIWVEVNARLVTRHGHPLAVQGVARDISDRKRAEEAARQSEQRYRTFFEQSRDAINITTREGKTLEVNESFMALFGYAAEEIAELNAVDLYADPVDRKRFQEAIEAKGAVTDYEVKLRKKDGSEIDCLLTSTVRWAEDGTVSGYQGVIRDITDQKRTEEAIKRLAYHDPLTGLPNRILFSDRLGVALAEARRSNRPHAVMLLDLDHFKKVNDTLGHTMGDRLLQAVAERLTTLLRESDTICRMGGDEFLLSIRGIARLEDGLHVANKILQAVRKPFTLEGRELHITTSLGVAIYPEDGQDVDSLIKNADLALYRAKEEGRDNLQRYTASQDQTETTPPRQATT